MLQQELLSGEDNESGIPKWLSEKAEKVIWQLYIDE